MRINYLINRAGSILQRNRAITRATVVIRALVAIDTLGAEVAVEVAIATGIGIRKTMLIMTIPIDNKLIREQVTEIK